ncbi:MAG: rhomboid family intramembrane serine protease [Nitrospirota bacterium]|nr:rhomboid family intramembrane serine protease [Nitrospirota bacterium]
MIPIRDENPTERFPVVTVALLAVNIIIYAAQFLLGPESRLVVFSLGAVPYEITHGVSVYRPLYVPTSLTLITSMFIHGGFLHLAGNMLYLWIFGNNVEDRMGRWRFMAFYLVCGLAAVFAHIIISPDSRMPMVGASGAISGILGAYLILFPRAKVLTVIPIFFMVRVVHLPAVFLIGFWILLQVINGIVSLKAQGGVAWFAHIGGFIAGLALVKLFARRKSKYWLES